MNKLNRLIKSSQELSKLNHIIRRLNSSNKSCVPSEENTIIFNKNFRLCKHCKYIDYNGEKCKKFGEHVITNGKYNVVMGKYEHLPADVCRRDETKCGESAVFYEEMTKKESESKAFTWLVCNVAMPAVIVVSVVVSFNMIIRDLL